MDTPSALNTMLSSPLARDIALIAVPALIVGLVLVFRQERKQLSRAVREQLNLLTEQNKEVADLKNSVVNLKSQYNTSQERLIDLKNQVDCLHSELEKTRTDFNINQLYSSIDQDVSTEFDTGISLNDTQFQVIPSLQADGITEMLRSLETEQPPIFTKTPAPPQETLPQKPSVPLSQQEPIADPIAMFHTPPPEAVTYTQLPSQATQKDNNPPVPREKAEVDTAPKPVTPPIQTPSDTAFDLDQYL